MNLYTVWGADFTVPIMVPVSRSCTPMTLSNGVPLLGGCWQCASFVQCKAWFSIKRWLQESGTGCSMIAEP